MPGLSNLEIYSRWNKKNRTIVNLYLNELDGVLNGLNILEFQSVRLFASLRRSSDLFSRVLAIFLVTWINIDFR